MKKPPYAAGALLALMVLQTGSVYANPVGKITIKEAPAPTVDELALSSIQQMKQPQKNMGKINISQEILDSIMKTKKEDSAEMVRVKRQLADAIEAANDQYYEKALTIMEHLHAEHPESRTIQKWLGIYQNWAGKYEESSETFSALRASYTLNSKEVDSDFMLAYYTLDNDRHLWDIGAARLQKLEDLAEKQNVFLLDGRPYKDIAKSLAAYQKFMVETNCGETLTPTDSKSLDELWKKIPKEKQAHLDNYYGYNIDELTPIYANFYHRKDLNDAYEARRKLFNKHIADAEIKEKEDKPAEGIDNNNQLIIDALKQQLAKERP